MVDNEYYEFHQWDEDAVAVAVVVVVDIVVVVVVAVDIVVARDVGVKNHSYLGEEDNELAVVVVVVVVAAAAQDVVVDRKMAMVVVAFDLDYQVVQVVQVGLGVLVASFPVAADHLDDPMILAAERVEVLVVGVGVGVVGGELLLDPDSFFLYSLINRITKNLIYFIKLLIFLIKFFVSTNHFF